MENVENVFGELGAAPPCRSNAAELATSTLPGAAVDRKAAPRPRTGLEWRGTRSRRGASCSVRREEGLVDSNAEEYGRRKIERDAYDLLERSVGESRRRHGQNAPLRQRQDRRHRQSALRPAPPRLALDPPPTAWKRSGAICELISDHYEILPIQWLYFS